MGAYGYEFYFTIDGKRLTLPITPAELKVSTGSNNKVITLINEGDVNILKSPSLTEIEFEARFPMRQYPYSRTVENFETYHNTFTDVMVKKKPIIFNVIRTTPNGSGTWGTTCRVSIELFETNESADEGDDVIATFKLKEYKDYGVKKLPNSYLTNNTSTANENRSTDGKSETAKPYVVKSGDCLWNIAKAAYGDGSKWTAIYEYNKEVIESTAEKHRGKGKGSSNGHWIYPGTELIIPGISDANLTVDKLKNNTGTGTTTKHNTQTSVGDADKYRTFYRVNVYDVETAIRSGTIKMTYTYCGVTKTRTVSWHKNIQLVQEVDAGSTFVVEFPIKNTEKIIYNATGWSISGGVCLCRVSGNTTLTISKVAKK